MNTELWVVGQIKSIDDFQEWEFQGVFDSKDKAIKACKTSLYFIGPTKLNQELPQELQLWQGVEYPLWELE